MLVERMRPFTSTIFTEISRLAVETGAISSAEVAVWGTTLAITSS